MEKKIIKIKDRYIFKSPPHILQLVRGSALSLIPQTSSLAVGFVRQTGGTVTQAAVGRQ